MSLLVFSCVLCSVYFILLCSLDDEDIPSKFGVSTPAFLYKVLPHGYGNLVSVYVCCTI